MKIVHLCFVEPYLDGWSYQANLLPEYQAKAGHTVVVVAGLNHCPNNYKEYKDSGKHKKTYQISRVKVIRLPLLFNLFNRLILPKGLRKVLYDEAPDVIFMHSLNNLSIVTVARYKKKTHCKLYTDVHSDWYNSGRNALSRYLLHGFFWRLMYVLYQKQLDKVFAITEDCADFARRYNRIDGQRIELLNLGADTDGIRFAQKQEIRKEIRTAYGIADNDFIIATAGKINTAKKVDLLIEAVKAIGADNIKLLIIGSMEKNCKEQLEQLAGSGNCIIFVGWQESRRMNDFFLASDIAAFPGTQSVIWQTAICCGLPVILRWWGKTVSYLNIGNALFLQSDDVQELVGHIRALQTDAGLRAGMSAKAMELCISRLSYDNVARRSIPNGT